MERPLDDLVQLVQLALEWPEEAPERAHILILYSNSASMALAKEILPERFEVGDKLGIRESLKRNGFAVVKDAATPPELEHARALLWAYLEAQQLEAGAAYDVDGRSLLEQRPWARGKPQVGPAQQHDPLGLLLVLPHAPGGSQRLRDGVRHGRPRHGVRQHGDQPPGHLQGR